jgi:hypothetical protein
MQLTYTLPADALNKDFIDNIKNRFNGKKVIITVEDVPDQTSHDQMACFDRMEVLRKKIDVIKVDPNLDLPALANDVNL